MPHSSQQDILIYQRAHLESVCIPARPFSLDLFRFLLIVMTTIVFQKCFDQKKHAYLVEKRKLHRREWCLECCVTRIVTDVMFTNRRCKPSNFLWFCILTCSRWNETLRNSPGSDTDLEDMTADAFCSPVCIFRIEFLLFFTSNYILCSFNGHRNVSLQIELFCRSIHFSS